MQWQGKDAAEAAQSTGKPKGKAKQRQGQGKAHAAARSQPYLRYYREGWQMRLTPLWKLSLARGPWPGLLGAPPWMTTSPDSLWRCWELCSWYGPGLCQVQPCAAYQALQAGSSDQVCSAAPPLCRGSGAKGGQQPPFRNQEEEVLAAAQYIKQHCQLQAVTMALICRCIGKALAKAGSSKHMSRAVITACLDHSHFPTIIWCSLRCDEHT